jgi:lipoprotein-anchoring transpeptidase ErfK/SrfK
MRVVLMVLLLLGTAACRPADLTTGEPADRRGSTPTTSAPPAPVPTTTAPETTMAPPTTTPSPTTGPAPPPSAPEPVLFRPGDNGPAVGALQARLDSLGYWLGPLDSTYGPGTAHAVTAFQKATGLAHDGVTGPATQAALERATRIAPRSTGGHVIEVDLRRQLVIVADDGVARWILDTSTGAVAGTTPVGRYRIQRQVEGFDTGPYGPLYRPKYFHEGVALHGYPSVPGFPASHGCVRVTNAAIDLLWSTGTATIGTGVWVY